jgi:putative DNA primase/helicase
MSIEISKSVVLASVEKAKRDQEKGIKGASLDELRRRLAQEGDLVHPLVLTRIEQLEMEQSNDDNSHRHQSEELVLYEPDPWPDAVDGAAVLSEVKKALLQHMSMRQTDATVATLWAAHAHCFDQFDHSPRLAISAPAPGCGKTVLLSYLLGNLVPRPSSADTITPAVFFRMAAAYKPTFLIDEVDAWFRDDSLLPAAINGGFSATGNIPRCVGDSHQVKQFSTFTPTALAGINLIKRLTPALLSRSIVIELERALPNEVPIPFDKRRHRAALLELGQKLARWSNDKRALLHDCDPMLPVGVINREADKWQPLFTIADIAGGVWPELAAQALLASSSTMSETKEVQLLVDIAKVLRMNNYQMEEGIFTSDLIEDLCGLEDSSWKDYNFRHRFAEERQIQPRQLSNLIKAFHLRPTSIRQGDLTKKGYKVAALKKVIDRYV